VSLSRWRGGQKYLGALGEFNVKIDFSIDGKHGFMYPTLKFYMG
jgi:hypothetical protein